MSRRAVQRLNRFFLLLGLCLLVWLILRSDPSVILEHVLRAGWALPLAILVYVVGLWLSALAWRETIHPEGLLDPSRPVSALRMTGVFWAGHAINAVTPAGVVGEVFKGAMLEDRVRVDETVASQMLTIYLRAVVEFAFATAAPLICLLLLPLPATVIVPLLVGAGGMVVVLVGVRILIHWGLAHRLVLLVGKLPLVRISDPDKVLARATQIDVRMRSFRRERPGAFLRTILYHLIVRFTQAVELWVLLYALMPGASLRETFVLAMMARSASILISWAAAFVPARIGVNEGGLALLFNALGRDPAVALTMELLRRVRTIVGVSAGLLIGTALQRRAAKRLAAQSSAENPFEAVAEQGEDEDEGQVDDQGAGCEPRPDGGHAKPTPSVAPPGPQEG